MDPNANLARQRHLCLQIQAADARYDERTVMMLASELTDLVLALDDWIRSGGFLPHDWERAPSA